MADVQHSDEDALLSTRRARSSALRERRTLPTARRALVTPREQIQSLRRRPSALRRAVRNADSFHRNRAHRVRRSLSTASESALRRVRTRSMARIEAGRQQAAPGLPLEQSSTEAKQTRDFGEWKPSTVVGSPLWLEGEDLSAIEIADRKIAQTRLWADHYQGVSSFVRMHQEAIRERAQLDETAEVNTKPRQVTTAPLLPTFHSTPVDRS